ncbi:hypothetical protein PGT21_017205 [Puccinia graminis f. sp. tritici]|uniref:Secreted protein n=1 Tax=Puccinia graminis f. sp. tritici TaxID=56615 RepID=A0A5B0MIQ5_PUCGR|nr:hypothetical protein PGTUg99_001992 [Puccinia graminis f. sp. tritici]KAA1077057.1 hypothetical protein PGTUg99_000963 [Puccinia graminis f. sp. tritici]KAA1090895.1 hypothetical protein PGT21_017205 [Puccinia graminis f. sp. tritici]
MTWNPGHLSAALGRLALLRDTSFILSALILTHAQSFHSSRQVGSILANSFLRLIGGGRTWSKGKQLKYD